MTDVKRRSLLRGSLAAGAVGVAAGASLLTPHAVLAARPKETVAAENPDDALNGLLGTKTREADAGIKLKVPEIAENGAVVPVTVESDREDIESISILVPGNPNPLTASFDLGPGALGLVSTRIKMGKTSKIIAVAETKDKAICATKEIKVTIGGCGG